MISRQDVLSQFGDRLRHHRRRAGLTQGELAERAGIARQSVNNIEVGRFAPTIETVARLAEAIGVPAAELVGETRPAAESPPRWLW